MTDVFAQQPIFDLQGNIYGCELLYRGNQTADRSEYTDGDVATASVLSNAFIARNMLSIDPGQRAFVNYTGTLLSSGTPLLLDPEVVVIEVLETVVDSDEVLHSLENLAIKGYTIALDDFVASSNNKALYKICKMIKLDFRITERDNLLALACQCRKDNKIMLAEKIETEEEFIFAKSIGCILFQGYYFAKPRIVSHNTVKPSASSLLSLFAAVFATKPDLTRIANIIKYDAALQVRVLGLTTGMSATLDITSIEGIVTALGIERLRDWAYLLGLHYLGTAVYETKTIRAVSRALFCEYLAKQYKSPQDLSESAYFVGSLSSVLDDEYSLSHFSPFVNLNSDICAALCDHTGILADFLDITLAYERRDYLRGNDIAKSLGISTDTLKSEYEGCCSHSGIAKLRSMGI